MDVSEYWAKLKASTVPKAVLPKSQGRVLSTGIGTGRNHDAARDQYTDPNKHLPTCQPASQVLPVHARVEHAKSDSTATDTSILDEDSFRQQASRLLEGLKADAPAQRLRACRGLQQLMQQVVPSTPSQPQHSSATAVLVEVLEELLGGQVGKGLLRRLADSSQAVREVAAQALLKGLQVAPGAVLALLPYAVPVLGERLTWQQGTNKVVVESCEEVRLLCCQLTARLVALAGKALTAYGAELIDFMQFMLADSYYEINLVGCNTIVDLNAALGMRLASVSKALVAAALPLTTHPRHRVRCAAVRAVRATMHQNAHEMILEMIAWRDPNVVPVAAFYGDDLKVNFAGKLATDQHPAVRLEWVATLRDWLLNLRERVDHEPRLLPYLLSALTDPVPDVANAAVETLQALGAAYEVEHAKELAEVTAYLPSPAQSLAWLEDANKQQPAGDPTAPVPAAAGVGSMASRDAPAPPPGVDVGGLASHMWGLGVVRVVQAQCARSLYALLAELLAWQEDARRAAAVLLRTMLFFASGAMHQQAQQLLQGLCRAVSDPGVQPIVLDCCSLLAASLPTQLLLQLLLPRVAETSTDPVVQAGIVRLLAAVARGASCRPHDLPACLPQLLDVLDGQQAAMLSADTQLRAAAKDLLLAVLHMPTTVLSCFEVRVLNAAVHLSLQPQSQGGCCWVQAPDRDLQPVPGNPCEASLLQQAATNLGFPTSYVALQAHMHALLDSCDASTSINPTLTTAVLGCLLREIGQPQQSSPNRQGEDAAAAAADSSSQGTRQSATPAVAADSSQLLTRLTDSITVAMQRALPQLASNAGCAEALLDALMCILHAARDCTQVKSAAGWVSGSQSETVAVAAPGASGGVEAPAASAAVVSVAAPAAVGVAAACQCDQQGTRPAAGSTQHQGSEEGADTSAPSSAQAVKFCSLLHQFLIQVPDGTARKQALACVAAAINSGLLHHVQWCHSSDAQGSLSASQQWQGPALLRSICTHGCGSAYAATRHQACSTLQCVCSVWAKQLNRDISTHDRESQAAGVDGVSKVGCVASQHFSCLQEVVDALLGCVLDAHVAVRLAACAATHAAIHEVLRPVVMHVHASSQGEPATWLLAVVKKLCEAYNSEEDACVKDSIQEVKGTLHAVLGSLEISVQV